MNIYNIYIITQLNQATDFNQLYSQSLQQYNVNF